LTLLFLWWGPEWVAAGGVFPLLNWLPSAHALHGCTLCYHASAISINHRSTIDLILDAWTLETAI
jgi:hypothetical protein